MLLSVAFLYNNTLCNYILDTQKSSKLTIGSGTRDNIYVSKLTPSQIIIKAKYSGISISAKKLNNFSIKDVPMDCPIRIGDCIIFYFSDYKGISNNVLELPENTCFTVGRSEKRNDVVIGVPFISSEHFSIKRKNGIVEVCDLNSTNGIFVNGEKVKKAYIKSGDVLSILTVRIYFDENKIYFENVGDDFLIKEIADKSLYYKKREFPPNELLSENSQRIDLSASPDKMLNELQNEKKKYISSFADLIRQIQEQKTRKICVAYFAYLLKQVNEKEKSMPVFERFPRIRESLPRKKIILEVPPVKSVSLKKSTKSMADSVEKDLETEQRYIEYIKRQKARIEFVAQVQREIITLENPSPTECVEILHNRKRDLWARTTNDDDFLDVRIGLGSEKLCVQVEMPECSADYICTLKEKIINETDTVSNIPIRISLLKNKTIGFVGGKDKVVNLIKNILAEVAVTHFFEDVKIAGVFEKSEYEVLGSLRCIPHMWSNDRQHSLLTFDNETETTVLKLVNDILNTDNENTAEEKMPKKPHCIIIFGSEKLAKSNKEVINKILKDNSTDVTLLILCGNMQALPTDCSCVVNVDDEICYFDKNKLSNRGFFTMDKSLENDKFNALAREMFVGKLKK